jgi:type II secretory pathway pseudopilin PulG
MGRPTATGRRQRGFTYLSLLFFMAVLGVGLAATAISWRTAMQREKERELLFVGAQFQQAIALYYHRSPGEPKEFPKKLNDLLKDARFPTVERYLRRVYRDPLTGKNEWGLVPAPEGGIIGVYSLSRDTPIRTVGLEATEPGAGVTYQDWKFVVRP